MLDNKILLITGGTGSFGNAVMERFLHSSLKEIRIFSRDEKKQDDMRRKYQNAKLKFYIGDVRDKNSIVSSMKNVNYVFHAAALKQVPSCEFFPMEAVKTNIWGTENVLDVAIEEKVEKVICLSTDKAAYPINSMGMSKALMEKVFLAKARLQGDEGTLICGTRYGNVMASRGSVIPLFIEQIKKEAPLTITDPNMTRFLMNLDEAVDLVLFAFKQGISGDIFVQKSPAATVLDLANALKTLFSSNSEIKFIGTRHGEKLFETLLTREEFAMAKDLGDFYQVALDKRDLNYDTYFKDGSELISSSLEYNSHNTKRLKESEIIEKLLNVEFVKKELQKWKK